MVAVVRPPSPTKAAGSSSGAKGSTAWTSILLNGAFIDTKAKDYHQKGGWSLGYHTGEDFSAKFGTMVRTPMTGTVTKVGFEANGLGNYVTVRMLDGNYIVFGHLSKVGVSQGARLRAGSYIGNVGETGRAFGSHLHVEIRTKASGGRWGAGNFMNPIAYLSGHTTRGDYSPPDAPTGGGQQKAGAGSSSTTTTTGGGGGGGITGVGGFTKKDYLRWLDAKFGSLAVLRQLDAAARKELGGKSIDWLVDILAKEKITDENIVASYMMQTGWFKKYGEEASRRLVAEKTRPGVFSGEVAKYRSSVDAALDALGVHLSAKALGQIARDSYIYGWDVTQAVDEAQRQFAATGSVTYDGGAIGEAQDDLELAAWELGVELTGADIRQLRTDVINGEGIQSQLDVLRERSANLYTVFADQIRAGKSLRQVGGAYFEKMADLLELGSPDQIDMTDPLMTGGRAFMTADPATGKMVPKGLWDFERDIRADARWLGTKNARDTIHSAAGDIAQLMGLG